MNKQDKLFTIGQFAAMHGINKKTLISKNAEHSSHAKAEFLLNIKCSWIIKIRQNYQKY